MCFIRNINRRKSKALGGQGRKAPRIEIICHSSFRNKSFAMSAKPSCTAMQCYCHHMVKAEATASLILRCRRGSLFCTSPTCSCAFVIVVQHMQLESIGRKVLCPYSSFCFHLLWRSHIAVRHEKTSTTPSSLLRSGRE